MDEDDVATYTIRTIDDPRTLNKTVYLRPPENVLTQRELIEKWEKLIGKQLEKSSISEQDFLSSMKGKTTTPKPTLPKIKIKMEFSSNSCQKIITLCWCQFQVWTLQAKWEWGISIIFSMKGV